MGSLVGAAASLFSQSSAPDKFGTLEGEKNKRGSSPLPVSEPPSLLSCKADVLWSRMTSVLLLLSRLTSVKGKATRDEERISVAVLQWMKHSCHAAYSPVWGES